MIDYIHFHAFYVLLFLFLIIVTIVIGFVIRGKSSDKKDTFIFAKSSDNAKDVTIHVTNSMKDMHDKIIEIPYTSAHEHEMHSMEIKLLEISDMLTLLTERVVILEQQKQKEQSVVSLENKKKV